jgi:hypothetical protein
VLQHRSLSAARTARRRSSSGVRATAVARRLLASVSGEHPAEAEKPPVDELIRPVIALAGPGARPGPVGSTDRVEAVGGTLRILSRAGRRLGHLVELPLGAPRS